MWSDDHLHDNEESNLRYEAYSRLQAAAVAFGEKLPIPEIVAIGGQSDGKSSLLEAFLGFRFNVREVEMGTRRPLIVQMVHDPSAETPRCRLQSEDGDEYGEIVPEALIAEAIKERTDSHLRSIKATVSSKPIVMRTEYAYCPNLTIIDTPGFILKARSQERDSTPEDIMEMVKLQAAPSNRIILFLQQSSVEWASSLWLHVVQEVDPTFSRTVVVSSKFDNRLKEFSEKWEVDRYLSASGYLSNNVKPFFVALPKDRNITSSTEFRSQIQEVDAAILRQLRDGIDGGFDEETYRSRIGFASLRSYLEEELARRYRDSAPATLSLLQERCEEVTAELKVAESALAAAEDVVSLRRAAMGHVAAMTACISSLLDGVGDCDPEMHGLTTEEEQAGRRSPVWPGVQRPVKPANAEFKLYGGAAFERCIEELQLAVRTLDLPAVPRDKVANSLLAQSSRGQSAGAGSAAEEIARAAARSLLAPLLEAACARLTSVLQRVFDIATQRIHIARKDSEHLAPYVAFHAALRSAYHSFINGLQEKAKGLVKHHLEAATSEWSIGLLPLDDPAEDRENIPPEHANPPRLEPCGKPEATDVLDEREPLRDTQLTIPETPSPNQGVNAADNAGHMRRHALRAQASREIVLTSPLLPARLPKQPRTMAAQRSNAPADKPDVYREVCEHAERLFRGIRQVVAYQATPSTLKSAFLEPLRWELTTAINLQMFACTDGEFIAMFNAAGAVEALEAERDALLRRAEGLIKSKDEFQELARCL